MCGRYTVRGIQPVADLFGVVLPKEFRPRYNIAPSQDVPVVRLDREGNRALAMLRWGLIPHWAKEPPKLQPINARAETVPTSGMFRQAFQRRRCLVPADGFYEWRKIDAKTKQPVFTHFPDDRPFALAGLWERWRPAEDAEPIDTVCIVTTTPNALMSTIHDRMPVILRPEDYAAWLDKGSDPHAAANLMRPYPDDELEAVPVTKLVNSPKNDVPECVAPLAE